MPETGLIAAFTGVRRPFELREYPVPEPRAGAALVKVELANICGSDMHIWRGEYKISRSLKEPYLVSMGHEMLGTIAALGEGLDTDSAGKPLAVGDRVVYRYFYPCGRCRACLRGTTPRCPKALRHRHPPDVWPHFNGAYGQYFYLQPDHTVFKVPDSVSADLAAPANCALAQVIYALEQAAAGLDDHIVIQGAGGLGINAIAVAKQMGAARVIVIDGIDERLELAREFGADVIIDLREFPSPKDRIARVKQLTDGWGADIVVEVAGTPKAIPEGLAMLGSGGTYLEIGNINQELTCEIDPSVLVHGGKKLLGIMWYEAESLKKAIDLLATCQHKYPFHKVISHKYPLREVTAAFQEQDTGHVRRTALLPWN